MVKYSAKADTSALEKMLMVRKQGNGGGGSSDAAAAAPKPPQNPPQQQPPQQKPPQQQQQPSQSQPPQRQTQPDARHPQEEEKEEEQQEQKPPAPDPAAAAVAAAATAGVEPSKGTPVMTTTDSVPAAHVAAYDDPIHDVHGVSSAYHLPTSTPATGTTGLGADSTEGSAADPGTGTARPLRARHHSANYETLLVEGMRLQEEKASLLEVLCGLRSKSTLHIGTNTTRSFITRRY
jgi:hypothetical protein